MSNDQSFQAAAWRRLKKNKGALAGLVVIIIAFFIAVFAYFIAPRGSFSLCQPHHPGDRWRNGGLNKAFLK